MHIQQKIDRIIDKNNSLVCVGLDSEYEKLPEIIKSTSSPMLDFNRAIVDATAPYAAAFKPNTAFYEAQGVKGIQALKDTCDYITAMYPEHILILDAKRADIGNTNNGYVTFAYDFLGVDMITLHPYLGSEAMQPFLEREDKGAIVLCRTSNSGSGEFQSLQANGEELFKHVAKTVHSTWNTKQNCYLVVGATYPKEMSEIRKIVGDMTFLVPGIGAQGGDIENTVKAGLNSQKAGMLINSSRSIIFASSGEDFAGKAAEEAKKLRDEINNKRS